MKYIGEILLGILMTGLVFGVVLGVQNDPYRIEQEVSVIPNFKQKDLEIQFRDSLELNRARYYEIYMNALRARKINSIPDFPIIKNPYRYGNIVYKLVSTCRDSTYTDYGNKEKILMFKCKRYKQLLKVRDFESSKYGIMRKDLDEINKKTCN